MTAHLHLGVRTPDLLSVHKAVRKSFPVVFDGDGWEAWGDRPGIAGNDDNTFHFIVEVESGKQARKVLNHLQTIVDLAPMRLDFQAGTTAVLTSPRDWSVEYKVWSE